MGGPFIIFENPSPTQALLKVVIMKKITLTTLILLFSTIPALGKGGGVGSLEDAIREYVLSHANFNTLKAGDVLIGDLLVSTGSIPEGSGFSFHVSPRRKGHITGRVSFNVELMRNGRRLRTIIVTTRVKVFCYVVRALRSIRMGEVIGEGDVEMRRVDRRLVPGEAARGLDSVMGMAAARPITAGRIVRADYLKRPLMVRKGQSLLVLAKVGHIMVRSRATALSDGGLDSPVKARTTGGRVISGVVTGPGRMAMGVR